MARKSRSTPRAVLFLFIAALSLLVGTAGAAPEAAFISNVTGGPAPLTVQFNDTSTGDPDGWTWYFGDETYEGGWTEQIDTAEWEGRRYPAAVTMPNGNIILMGGMSNSTTCLNDTWRSTDGGENWTEVVGSAEWLARYGHTSVVMPDGSIVLMGGYGHGYGKDVWRSTDEGATWTQVADAEWRARWDHTSVVMPNGNIILMGGSRGDTPRQVNDVWRSEDDGVTWKELPDPEWEARYGQAAVVMPDGSIILMGGSDDKYAYKNDVWRSDDGGETWTRAAEHAEWPARYRHTSVAMPDGSIVIMGGRGESYAYMNDVWRSTDEGATWTQVAEHAEWTARWEHTSVVMPDGSIVLMGGQSNSTTYPNDVWRLETAGSCEQSPTHTYTEPGTYTVTLQAYNDNGHNVTQKVAYITVTPPAPEARFTASVTSGTAPLTVQFTDQSTNNPDGWTWYFGDETYEGEWTEQTGGAGWARYLHDSVVLPDGSIIIMGGYTRLSPHMNDTWRSDDRGATWTQLPDANWTARNGQAAVALPDGSIVLMGGVAEGGKCQNDTWLSDDYGTSWTLMNASSGWMGRSLHSSIVMPDGSIIIMGGNGDKYLNDIWRSADRGATWTQVTEHAEWTARYGQAAVALPDGSIVLTGGEVNYEYLNDTWRSTDGGATWTQVTEHAEWTGRRYHTAVAVPDGSIVLMGGNGGKWQDDVWRSTDGGATWTLVNASAWPARSMFASVVMPDGSIIIMGGMGNSPHYLNDVWRLETAGSAAENPTHTYTEPGTYTVTLQAYNAFGFDSIRKSITVTSPSSGGGSGGGGSTVGPGGGYNVGGDSAVSTVTVTGTRLEMLIVTGRVQSSPGAGIPPAPGTPYQYIELTPARFEEIAGANITFSIPAAWLAAQGFAPGGIVLYRYNGTAWEALPTWVVDDAGSTVTFTATSPGFSLFAISGTGDEGAVTTPTAVETTPPATTQPTGTETTAAPAGGAAPEFPLGAAALVAGGVLVLAAGGYLVRRWWLRRQNPALFRDYD